MILQPFPCASPSGLNNRMDVEAVLSRPFRKVFLRNIHEAKLTHLIFGELHFPVFFTSVRRAMFHAIHTIVGACRPSQMSWVDALAVPTIMRCVPKIRRARPMSNFTDQTGYSNPSPFSDVVRISVPVDRKRPFDAIFGACFKGIKDKVIGFGHSLKLADFRR